MGKPFAASLTQIILLFFLTINYDLLNQKLLERTRARRENLQKKLAERPTAASRQMVKRPREPLTDTNNISISVAVPETGMSVRWKNYSSSMCADVFFYLPVVQVSSKPSPSKRRCSEENAQPSVNEENREPVVPRAGAPELPDPPTDKKPPIGPAGIRYSLEKAAARPAVQSEPLKQPESEKTPAPPDLSSSREAHVEATGSVHQRMEEDAAPAGGMKSRLQKLAEQRKCWDGEDALGQVLLKSLQTPSISPNVLVQLHKTTTFAGIADADCTPVLLVKRDAEVAPPAAPAPSSDMAVGRRGRLANLAATIGSWEDDLSHVNVPREKPAAAVNSNKPNVGANLGKPNATVNLSKPTVAVSATEKSKFKQVGAFIEKWTILNKSLNPNFLESHYPEVNLNC